MSLSRRMQLALESIIAITAAILYYRHFAATSQIVYEASAAWPPFRDDGASLWCGKAYEPQWPAIDPGGGLSSPSNLDVSVLDFQCYTRMNTYFHGEETAEVVFDLKPTTKLYSRAQNDKQHILITDDSVETLRLSLIGHKDITISMTKDPQTITFDITLLDLDPSLKPSVLSCSVTSQKQSAELLRNGDLYYLPPRPCHQDKSLTKFDRTTGMIMINSTTRGESLPDWTPFVPYGYYGTPSALQDLVALGFNILHVVPDLPSTPNYGYPSNYHSMILEAADLDIWVMHDMRWTWQHPDLLKQQLFDLSRATNLLTWYTGDEPDGMTVDPATFSSSTALLRAQESRYHVVAAVFNCADFEFERYTNDIDIVMTDPYPIGIQQVESIYHTPCNATYGCCGCDLCSSGTVFDVVERLDLYSSKLANLGRKAALWIVTQAFGEAEHWSRLPTVKESIAMQVLALNHGSTGSVSWNWVEGNEKYEMVRDAISKVARFVIRNTGMIETGYKQYPVAMHNVDISVWRNDTHGMVGYVNQNDSINELKVSSFKGEKLQLIEQLCDIDVVVDGNGVITFTGHRIDMNEADIIVFEFLRG